MRKILCVLLAVVFVWGSLPVSAETAESVSVSAYAAVLYEPVSGTVLFEKNSREVLPVASTTKIMTALLAFESEHRGDPVTITPEMISVEGSSMGLRAGEVLALGDIARGMMMASGNDGANAIALYLSDSAEAFSEKMNARAAELHMMQTHFVTPSGLDAEGHGSTAYDMALLAAEAMQNEEFAAAVGQTTLSVPFISPEKTVRYENHNRLLKLYPDCTGIKTGFTKKAGRCLVSSAERDGARLICVTLNAPDDWNDHMNLYDYGFAQLAERTLKDEALVASAAHITALGLLGMPLIGIYYLAVNYLQSVGKAVQASVLSVLRQGAVYVPLLLSLHGMFGLFGVFYAAPAADIFSTLLAILHLYRAIKKDLVSAKPHSPAKAKNTF